MINHAGKDQEPERSRQIARPRSHEIARFSSLLALIVPTYGRGQSKEVHTGHTLHIYCTTAQPVKDPQTEPHLPSWDQLRNNAAERIRLAEAALTSAHQSSFIAMAGRWLPPAERPAAPQAGELNASK